MSSVTRSQSARQSVGRSTTGLTGSWAETADRIPGRAASRNEQNEPKREAGRGRGRHRRRKSFGPVIESTSVDIFPSQHQLRRTMDETDFTLLEHYRRD